MLSSYDDKLRDSIGIIPLKSAILDGKKTGGGKLMKILSIHALADIPVMGLYLCLKEPNYDRVEGAISLVYQRTM